MPERRLSNGHAAFSTASCVVAAPSALKPDPRVVGVNRMLDQKENNIINPAAITHLAKGEEFLHFHYLRLPPHVELFH